MRHNSISMTLQESVHFYFGKNVCSFQYAFLCVWSCVAAIGASAFFGAWLRSRTFLLGGNDMKKILALLLTLSMLMALAACGKDGRIAAANESTGLTTNPVESTNKSTTDTQVGIPGTTINPTSEAEAPAGTSPSATTAQPTTKPLTTPPTTESPTTGTIAIENDDYKSIVQNYLGRWYLAGYADVCIDVSQYDYPDASVMRIRSYNFSLPLNGTSDFPIIEPYTIYPNKYIDPNKGGGWSEEIEIGFENWNNSLEESNVIMGDNCIIIGNHTFVRAQGSKDRYFDTCYREALGIWYLYNNPQSSIEIFTYSDMPGDFENSAYFGINATWFDFSTFATNLSYYVGGGYADRKDDWEKYGISVESGTLTVTNKNGTRTFYKEKTYQKVTGLTINVTSVSLRPGETSNISATVSPLDAYNKSVIWTSSDSSVATVTANGVVTAVGEGIATIIAKTVDGNYSAACNVTVSIKHVTGITLDTTFLDMTVGHTQQISATVFPSDALNKNVTWTSDNTAVATVSSSGQITAIRKGTAIISVTSADGGYTATCTVTVTDPPLTVKASIGVGYYVSSSGSIQGVFVEANATGGSGNYVEYYIKVYFNGSLVAEGAKNQLIVTLANGTYTAEVYVKDSNGNEATSTGSMTLSGY